MKFDYVTTH